MSIEIDLKIYGDLCDKRRELLSELADITCKIRDIESRVSVTNIGGGNYIGTREFQNISKK